MNLTVEQDVIKTLIIKSTMRFIETSRVKDRDDSNPSFHLFHLHLFSLTESW